MGQVSILLQPLDHSELHLNDVAKVLPSDLVIRAFGCDQSLPPAWNSGMLLRDTYAIEYCTRGRGILTQNGISHEVTAGQCFITQPNVLLSERADDSDPWELYWISFWGKDTAVRYLNALDISVQNPVLPWRNKENVLFCIQDMFSPPGDSPLVQETHQRTCLYALFRELFRLSERLNMCTPDVTTQERFVADAIHYIECFYQNDLKISDLSAHVGLNRSYLFSLFKKQLGISPQDYLISYRIQKACKFLALPDATISAVAYSVGYDPPVFSRVFKRVTGISPSQYRKNLEIKEP